MYLVTCTLHEYHHESFEVESLDEIPKRLAKLYNYWIDEADREHPYELRDFEVEYLTVYKSERIEIPGDLIKRTFELQQKEQAELEAERKRWFQKREKEELERLQKKYSEA